MENKNKSFKELAESARKSTSYFVQGAILDFTEDVVCRMQTQNLTKTDLAGKLNTSPAYITKLLGGNTNFTLETMVKVALAVDSELRVHLQPKGSICQWFDVLESPTQPAEPVSQSDEWQKFHKLSLINRITNNKGPNEELALAA